MAKATIKTMRLSGNREEHFVRIENEGRSMDLMRFSQDRYNRALFTRDELNHVLLGEPKPDLMADKYADKKE